MGFYSGTFDPIHEGHIKFARQAVIKGGLDKVFFMVEPKPRRKQGVKAYEHRAAMVALTIKDIPAFGSIVLDQNRFSIQETLPLLSKRFKGSAMYFLMGDDFLSHLTSWPHLDQMLTRVQLILGLRRHKISEINAYFKTLAHTKGLHATYQVVPLKNVSFSSSHIRAQLKAGLRPDGLPDNVLDYIVEHGLYASSANE